MAKVIDQHDRTDARWLDYEMDVAKLLDFPMMTDMRDPLTIGFHKARQRADLLRPDTVDDIVGDRDAQLDYRDAVHDCVSAFDIAEAERFDGAAAISPQRTKSGWPAPRVCCVWPVTAALPRKNARRPTPRRKRNSTGCWCCRPRRGPASNERSPARSRPDDYADANATSMAAQVIRSSGSRNRLRRVHRTVATSTRQGRPSPTRAPSERSRPATTPASRRG